MNLRRSCACLAHFSASRSHLIAIATLPVACTGWFAAAAAGMVSTRKRSAAAADQQAVHATPKRVKAGSSSPAAGGSTPQARGLRGSPATAAGKQAGASVPRTGGSKVGAPDGLHMQPRRRSAIDRSWGRVRQLHLSRSTSTSPAPPPAGSRGAAFLAAAGIALPAADAPPKLSTKKESAVKARRPAAREEAAASKPAPASAPRRNPLLQQELPRKLQALLDMFGESLGQGGLAAGCGDRVGWVLVGAQLNPLCWRAFFWPLANPPAQVQPPHLPGPLLHCSAAGLQTVYEVMRKRGQRTTFQNMRQAVEEASGRRFLVRRACPATLENAARVGVLAVVGAHVAAIMCPTCVS